VKEKIYVNDDGFSIQILEQADPCLGETEEVAPGICFVESIELEFFDLADLVINSFGDIVFSDFNGRIGTIGSGGPTLFAVTDEFTPPLFGEPSETLFTLDLITGTPTQLCSLGIEENGHSLAFNPLDGKLYHGSGVTFRSIDSTDGPICGTTTIPASLDPPFLGVASALTFSESIGKFLWTSADFGINSNTLSELNVGGSHTIIDTLDHTSKGLAFATVGDSTTGGAKALFIAPGFDDSSTFDITVTVTDDGTPTLDDSETFTLTVIDGSPFITTPIPNINVQESSNPGAMKSAFAPPVVESPTVAKASPFEV